MTEIGNGGQDEECLQEESAKPAPPEKKIVQRLASERHACTFVKPDGKQCVYARTNLDDPDGRCLLPEHQK